MGAWKPMSASELEALISAQLQDCSPTQRESFLAHRVPMFQVPIERFGQTEHVFVVARKGEEVMYFEDVEEGFNISSLGPNGEIAQAGFEQDPLKFAVQKWK